MTMCANLKWNDQLQVALLALKCGFEMTLSESCEETAVLAQMCPRCLPLRSDASRKTWRWWQTPKAATPTRLNLDVMLPGMTKLPGSDSEVMWFCRFVWSCNQIFNMFNKHLQPLLCWKLCTHTALYPCPTYPCTVALLDMLFEGRCGRSRQMSRSQALEFWPLRAIRMPLTLAALILLFKDWNVNMVVAIQTSHSLLVVVSAHVLQFSHVCATFFSEAKTSCGRPAEATWAPCGTSCGWSATATRRRTPTAWASGNGRRIGRRSLAWVTELVTYGNMLKALNPWSLLCFWCHSMVCLRSLPVLLFLFWEAFEAFAFVLGWL